MLVQVPENTTKSPNVPVLYPLSVLIAHSVRVLSPKRANAMGNWGFESRLHVRYGVLES